MKKLVLSIIVTLLPLMANAQYPDVKVEINALLYNIYSRGTYAEVAGVIDQFYGEITIPESIEYEGTTYKVRSIGPNAFSYTNLTSVIIPESVTSIGDAAFEGCTGLTSIELPFFLQKIQSETFSGCSSLTSIVIPEKVETIYDHAFSGCSSLNKVEFSTDVRLKTIGSQAFSDCSSLDNVQIPWSVTQIGDRAFYNCTSLYRFGLGSPIYLGNDIFYNTKWYNSQPDGLLYFYDILLGYKGYQPEGAIGIKNGTRLVTGFSCCGGLTHVVFPNSVEIIGGEAFAGCDGLTSVTIPNSVKTIGPRAFWICSSVTSFEILSKEITILDKAFSDCSSLTDFYCHCENIPTLERSSNSRISLFMGSPISNATLHVPAVSIEKYKQIIPWSKFKEIVALPGEVIEGDANGDSEVNVADVDFVIESIGADVATNKAADVNGDGEINVADVDYIIERIK